MQSWVSVHEYWGPLVAVLQNATDIDRSWARNDVGLGQFRLPQGDSQQHLLRRRHMFVIHNDAGLPPWVGSMAPGQEIDQDGTLTTFPLKEITWLLGYLFTGPEEVYPSRSAGGILQDAASRALLNQPMPIRLRDFQDGGAIGSWEWRDNSILSVAQQLAEASGSQVWAEFEVTQARIWMDLYFGSRRGLDLSSRVHLIEGQNVGTISLRDPDEMLPERIDVIGSAAPGTSYADRPRAFRTTEAILGGPLLDPATRRDVVYDEHITDDATAEQRALAVLLASLRPEIHLTVVDPTLWPDLQLDNDVRITLPSYGIENPVDGIARIVRMQPDEAAGEMDLDLEVLSGYPSRFAAT